VSVGGGNEPIWSADSTSIYYRVNDRVIAVDITKQLTLRASAPRELFRGPSAGVDPAAASTTWDPTAVS
jgi:hypothetical protein